VDTKQYAETYPAAVKRLIDLFSVNRRYLLGVPNIETDPYKKIGILLNPMFTDTAMITADKFYFLKHKETNSTRVFYANKLGQQEIYSLDHLTVNGLLSPISKNYYVYTYDESTVNEEVPRVDNLLDLTNSFAFSKPLSTIDNTWYEDGGVVETLFNNLLTKQLFGK
jgi:hypothetical protein